MFPGKDQFSDLYTEQKNGVENISADCWCH